METGTGGDTGGAGQPGKGADTPQETPEPACAVKETFRFGEPAVEKISSLVHGAGAILLPPTLLVAWRLGLFDPATEVRKRAS